MNPIHAILLSATLCCTAIDLHAADVVKIDPADFQSAIDHPYFPLKPGTSLTFREDEKGDVRQNVMTVTHETKVILGVPCVVVHDVLTRKGVLIEDTYDWFAQDKKGNVWYFGEETKEFDGGRISTKGSWEAGKNGAQPGIQMPANPQPGEPYRQEYLADEAEDMGQIVGLDETVKVPLGTFKGCVRIKEYSMLESGSAMKWYAKGIGFVRCEASSGEIVQILSFAAHNEK